MDKQCTTLTDPLIYRIGKMKLNRYWIQCPDGRMLQLDTDSKNVLERLLIGEPTASIAKELGIEEDDIHLLMQMLGLDFNSTISLIDETENNESSRKKSKSERIRFFNPWLERRMFTWTMIAAMIFSVIIVIAFMKNTSPIFIGGLKEQWIIAGFLTLSVLIHEIGHLLTMPRHRNISISVQWTGPLPLLSIICNEAWKLSKRQRMRINIAGFVADVIVCGFAATVGLLAEHLSPWIWTFLLVHMFRMIFAIWPLLPGDGYWMLVDLFNQPNLWMNAKKQLKKLQFSWLSFYAIARIMFLVLIWFLYAYVIYIWSFAIATKPFKEAMLILLHPAPLLISLNILNQLYTAIFMVVKKLKYS